MKTFEDSKLMKKYLKDDGSYCPFCDSDNISGGYGEFDASSAFRNVVCMDCKREWTEEFGLTGVVFLEKE